ncbi:hypothetical protein GQ53DRAFT_857051 [Thozetella sp. PMI_491]|nr:hypothetical protein GQ53DRAFT_857051 [Thozetella sp. PMI_491]
MKFSAAVIASLAATVLAAPTPAEQSQPQAHQAEPVAESGTQSGGEHITLYEQWGEESKSTRICSIKYGEKKCIEVDSSKGEPEYKCQGDDPDHFKSKCEKEAEKKLIEEYKRKKAFQDFEKKREFEEWEKKKGMPTPLPQLSFTHLHEAELEKYLHEHKHEHKPEWGPGRELKEFKEKEAFKEYEAKKAYEEYESKKKLQALKEKWEAEEAIDKLCSIKDKHGKCSKEQIGK